MAEGAFTRRSVGLTGGAVFGSLAALSTTIIPPSIQPFFPILPFLRFDPAEIFSVLAFLIFGPIPSLVTASVHWIFLSANGTTTPLGPAVKFAAVLTTLLGLWVGSKFYGRMAKGGHKLLMLLALMVGFAVLFRVGILLIVNYFVFTYIGPVVFGIDYLGFSQSTLQRTLGIKFGGPDLVAAMLFYTGVFNALHVLFSVLVPYALFTPVSLKVPEVASGHPWISRFTSRN